MFDLAGIEVIGQRINIRENGLRAKSGNRSRRRKERVGCRNDFIAGSDIQSHKRNKQGVRS